MLEDDARKKWCPMARILSAGDFFISTNGKEQTIGYDLKRQKELTQCIASDCMMWRWIGDKKDRDGYCGLAGWWCGGKP